MLNHTIGFIASLVCLSAMLGCQNNPSKTTPTVTQDGNPSPDLPNILLITLDDMGFGSTGAEGSTVPGITPHIDELASEGILFTQGYIVTPICGPSRAAILTGRYPHNSGMMGHGTQPPPGWTPPETVTPSISRYLRGLGYHATAILKHRRNKPWNTWDLSYNEAPYGIGQEDRSPAIFKERTRFAIEQAQEQGKPFFIYANPIDPHHPWPDTNWEKSAYKEWNPDNPYPDPSRRYTADEIEVPSFLPDLPGIRKNLIPYWESVHRGDECIGAVLEAVEESGMVDNTLVIFLSDHGMGATGAKAMLYHHGVRTPVIVRWPGKVPPNKLDQESVISAIDIFPTIIEAIDQPAIEGLDGESFLAVAKGRKDRTDRQQAYTAHNYYGDSIEKWYFPQRGVIDGDFSYIWNAYVDQPNGDRPFLAEGWIWVVKNAMTDDNPEFVAKIESVGNKASEEFFDLRKDPGSWNNLIGDPEYQEVIDRYRSKLEEEMRTTNDPQLQFWPH